MAQREEISMNSAHFSMRKRVHTFTVKCRHCKHCIQWLLCYIMHSVCWVNVQFACSLTLTHTLGSIHSIIILFTCVSVHLEYIRPFTWKQFRAQFYYYFLIKSKNESNFKQLENLCVIWKSVRVLHINRKSQCHNMIKYRTGYLPIFSNILYTQMPMM